MQVSIWVPVGVALISAAATAAGIWASRRTSSEAKELRTAELALAGLTALIAAAQEELRFCREALKECRNTLDEETRRKESA
jgi:hypothetical protein